jgi:hypothetical protein
VKAHANGIVGRGAMKKLVIDRAMEEPFEGEE